MPITQASEARQSAPPRWSGKLPNREACLDKEFYLNGRFLNQPATGVQRFTRQLCDALDRLLQADDPHTANLRWTCLAPPGSGVTSPWQCIPVREVGRLKGNLWEQIDLLLATRGRRLADLGNMGPLLKAGQAVVFHDASVFAFPHTYSRPFRLKHQLGLRVLGRTAGCVFTVSDFSRQEIARYAGIDPQRIHVLGEGCEHILAHPAEPGILERHGLGRRPYLLVVSNLSPHKNLAGLVRALQLIPNPAFEVVFAGITYAPVFQIDAPALPAAIRQVGQVTDGELRALYEGAAGFIFPSLYEGFGLPPLEAMACGCPVIASNTASLPEVCGPAALYCDPRDPQAMAAQILRLMTNPALQANLRQLGLQQAARFTWAETARRFIRELTNL